MPTDEYKRLRTYLNPVIRGTNTDAILESVAVGTGHLVDLAESVNEQLYIVSASGRYLDAKLAERDQTRPESVGLSDDIFKQIGIEVSNRKQVRDLIANILNIMYGEDYTNARVASSKFEPYLLENGDNLFISFDDQTQVEITFKTSQFANIATATAQEVADVISKTLKSLGRTGKAVAKDEGSGFFVDLISTTIGPSSSVKVFGGKAQNKLQFPKIRPTSGQPTTQWKAEVVNGGNVRLTWLNGPDPSIGKVKKNDYVNVYSTLFSSSNRGTFTVTKVFPGAMGVAYVEYSNPEGVSETVLQGNDEGVLFFYPQRFTINSQQSFATLYNTESRTLEIFIPSATKVIRRERIGSAHLQESGPSVDDNYGPYIFDTSAPYTVGGESGLTTQTISSASENIIQLDDATQFPDEAGFLVLGWGTDNEEGPIPYLYRPSSQSLMISPAYKFKKKHPVGTDVGLIAQNYPMVPDPDGSDYGFYITDTVAGRRYAEDLIRFVYATGIRLIINVLYPGDTGLGKYGTPTSEKTIVFGAYDDE